MTDAMSNPTRLAIAIVLAFAIGEFLPHPTLSSDIINAIRSRECHSERTSLSLFCPSK